ncbi:hypothetical protein PR048_015780 [Dryococelus australis]|uniref:Uncharacterized protein n=1 Tax=Dryococelus australis TaxID=614101 RepID=A0ABQ9HI28_9NEOP|nr:hypothetical protein PR048_015780 [Dryococelus australis]
MCNIFHERAALELRRGCKFCRTALYLAEKLLATPPSRNERKEETRNPPTSGIVPHDSHMRKSRDDPAGNRALFA